MSTLKVNQITDLNNAEIFEPNLMTAKSATGTSVDFTGIPSWVKRITVMFNVVSSNGSSNYLIQIGDSGGFETTGYTSGASNFAGYSSFTTGFGVTHNNGSGSIWSGAVELLIMNPSTNLWVSRGNLNDPTAATQLLSSAGGKSLSDTLTQVRITTVNGTDTFDAGTINVMYE